MTGPMRFLLPALSLGILVASGGVGAAREPLADKRGALLIVGGGLRDDNEEIYTAFLKAMPDPQGRIVIIPAASGIPAESAAAFTENLQRRGVPAERISVARIAMTDDPSTPEDESTWRENANSPEEMARLEGAAAIWFTGGDQSRVMEALVLPDGSESAALATIRERFARGAVIGGTSAGAAIMSSPMILQGDTAAALSGDASLGEELRLGRGLGFWQHVLVDQHFGQRARLGRLAVALSTVPRADTIGVGIDEDTAVLVESAGRTARVLGRGYVTVVALDRRRSRALPSGTISLLKAGSVFVVNRHRPHHADRSRTKSAGRLKCGPGGVLASTGESEFIADLIAAGNRAGALCVLPVGLVAGPLLVFSPTSYRPRAKVDNAPASLSDIAFSIVPLPPHRPE